MVEYYKEKSFFYKKYKNGIIIRISKKEFNKKSRTSSKNNRTYTTTAGGGNGNESLPDVEFGVSLKNTGNSENKSFTQSNNNTSQKVSNSISSIGTKTSQLRNIGSKQYELQSIKNPLKSNKLNLIDDIICIRYSNSIWVLYSVNNYNKITIVTNKNFNKDSHIKQITKDNLISELKDIITPESDKIFYICKKNKKYIPPYYLELNFSFNKDTIKKVSCENDMLVTFLFQNTSETNIRLGDKIRIVKNTKFNNPRIEIIEGEIIQFITRSITKSELLYLSQMNFKISKIEDAESFFV
jgi:hypothetical protein